MRGNDRTRAAQSRVACAEVKLMKGKGEELGSMSEELRSNWS